MKIALLLACCVAMVAMTGAVNYPDNPFSHLDLVRGMDYQLSEQQYELTQGILEQALQGLKFIIQKAENAIQKIVDQAGVLFDDVLSQAERLLDDAIDTISDIVEKALEAMNGARNPVSECLEIFPQKLQQIREDAIAKAKECFEHFFDGLKVVEGVFQDSASSFFAKVHDLEAIAEECVEENVDFFEQVNCIVRRVPEAADIALQIIKELGGLFSNTFQDSISLVNETRGCLLDVIRQARAEVKKVVEEFYECVQQKPDPQPTTEGPTEPGTEPGTETTTVSTTESTSEPTTQSTTETATNPPFESTTESTTETE
ncbi:uncharacterized protein LOC129745304 [Uranotaenia lowii]|uniref:uncharacterized protein LOC129745304 n=1 Tax=Uranotaenia lowii TaxID=190385 RepID=UPI002479B85E|nr:uncharacterized protein LOC129745304 [Uranotaenia lowii]